MRDYKVDNIRFFLIFLVVFGHLLELFSGSCKELIYRFIYSFHIPVLIFITGYFAKFNPKKIFISLVWPYLLLQTLYLLFQGYVIKGAESVTLNYTTPHWLLWYLLVVIFYYLLIPVLQRQTKTERITVFALSVAASLLAGLDGSIGYYLSLSRFFTFLPFFVAGLFCGNHFQVVGKPALDKKKTLVALFVCVAVLIPVMYGILSNGQLYSKNVLYGSYSYEKIGYTWVQRAVLLVAGFAWIVVLFTAAPGKKLPMISTVGKNTLPIFLFHGFAVRLLAKQKIFQSSETGNILLAVAIALGLLLLLGNPGSAWLCKWGFTGHWISRITSSKKREKKRVRA